MAFDSTNPNQTPQPGKKTYGPMRLGAIIIGALALVITLFLIPKLVENLAAGEVMVIQSIGGDLNCYTSPGPQWQGFGEVTKYPRQSAYVFDVAAPVPNPTNIVDTGKELQFNEGGTAHLYGSVNWEMPIDCKSIVTLHKQFNNPEGIVQRGVAKMVNLAIYLSGPMMSSTESVSERRAELVQFIDDQAQRGVYQTVTRQMERPDPINGEKHMVQVVEILREANGQPKRQQGSILEQYGINLQPITIERLKYSAIVEKQIIARQEANQSVQLAQATARKAEQDALTTIKQGEANAAKAKWEQETIKAKFVTEAQQKLEVATLAAKEAEQYKRTQILRGEGEAQYKQLVMAADGALEPKLEAFIKVQANWAEAFAQYGGAMVPAVQMGTANAGTNSVSAAQNLVDMLTAKTARDLSLDLSMVGRKAPPAK